MPGGSAGNIEAIMNNADAAKGYREDMFNSLGSWLASTGLTLTASTAPEIINIASTLWGVKWDHGDAATAIMLLIGKMPWQFAQFQQDLVLRFTGRKVDSGGDENADLCMQAQIRWAKPGILSAYPQLATGTVPTIATAGDTSVQTLTTVAKALLAAANTSATNANLTGFAEYEIDIGARLRAENKYIPSGADFVLEFGPDDTVGSGDMDVEVYSPCLCIRRHAALRDPSKRGRRQ